MELISDCWWHVKVRMMLIAGDGKAWSCTGIELVKYRAKMR